jgi:hypothetical protein
VEDEPLVTQPRDGGASLVLLDSHAFRNVMHVLLARTHSLFTIVVIRTEQRDATLKLGETILRELRGASGDLVGYLDGAIAVALHGTDHVGAMAFADRLRDEWHRAGRGELRVDIAEHPFAEQRVIELLTTDWSVAMLSGAAIDDAEQASDQAIRGNADEWRTGIAERQ